MPSTGPGRPPRPVPVPHPDEPIQQKAKVPELEKHLLDQLSSEEQNALNKKFEEAKDAEKKVTYFTPHFFFFQKFILVLDTKFDLVVVFVFK